MNVKSNALNNLMKRKNDTRMLSNEKGSFAEDENAVNAYKSTLSSKELGFLVVSKCQSHQPTLLCVVNQSGTVKMDFCEKDLNGANPILKFFEWVSNVVKPTNSSKTEKNGDLFVTHNSSAYDTQFIYKAAHSYFGTKNVNVLLHMNRMIELRIQLHYRFSFVINNFQRFLQIYKSSIAFASKIIWFS